MTDMDRILPQVTRTPSQNRHKVTPTLKQVGDEKGGRVSELGDRQLSPNSALGGPYWSQRPRQIRTRLKMKGPLLPAR